MSTSVDTATASAPAWLREIDVALAANPQILVTGNLRDLVLVPVPGKAAARPVSVVDALVKQLAAAGHTDVVVTDPVDGARAAIDSGTAATIARTERGDDEGVLDTLTEVIRRVVHSPTPCCLVIDSASRLVPGSDFTDSAVHRLLSTAEKLMVTARRLPVPGPHRTPLYNTVVWLLDRASDLPHWLTGSELARNVSIPAPDMQQRVTMARGLVGALDRAPTRGTPEFTELAQTFAARADGLTLRSMSEINRLAIDRRIPAADIDVAIQTYRVGVPDNPWQSDDLRKRIRAGTALLGERVFGQPAATRKALDILIRAAMGLSGAQTRSSAARPQGVLFFAGPTGVGKTELAKSIAELVFGRDDSFIRFDMSEFTSEHSEARLIGAPPGYTGFGSGGELTNAVRQQPFRLVLFDEIEKAHPRILDKFLQILEDGRLTDGTGGTVYFSETLIVFTSNLGVYRVDARGDRVPVVEPGDYDNVERKIRAAVAEHFTKEIGRPELLNRIGDNIVVFDFVSESVARDLVPKFVRNVVDRVEDQTGVRVEVADQVLEQIVTEALTKLEFGGRGVSNTVESMLVNPLARALFGQPPGAVSGTVSAIDRSAEGWQVTLT